MWPTGTGRHSVPRRPDQVACFGGIQYTYSQLHHTLQLERCVDAIISDGPGNRVGLGRAGERMVCPFADSAL